MLLRPGYVEFGWRRAGITRFAYSSGEMILCQRHADYWIRTDEAHRLTVRISDAALNTASNEMSKDVELPRTPKLVDPRVGALVAAVNAERVEGFPSGRRALNEYIDHHHFERNHQGKGNLLLFPSPDGLPGRGARIRTPGRSSFRNSTAAFSRTAITLLSVSVRAPTPPSKPSVRRMVPAPRWISSTDRSAPIPKGRAPPVKCLPVMRITPHANTRALITSTNCRIYTTGVRSKSICPV
jgi:hypothetical protein